MLDKNIRPELHYILADRWFRILEFSLIIGTFKYLSNKTGSFLLLAVYWISVFLFFNWFLELGEFIGDKIYKGQNLFKNIFITILVTIPFIIIFILISKVTEIVIASGYSAIK